ncbi:MULTISPECIES: TadG family pilus assembly protein [unclassified Methylophaga]|jgi:uncharacterized membrane protein|uniref:TadG family pilus assembly protein n=3 Tax=Methylophaga TaxID=40222 RepID=UPI000C8E628E|nr:MULTISPECIES: TadG family pilus assembly protein [unclassified Methylophaga]MAK66111.1 hypothetical protein [Methylophaga sp.]MAY17307.1 hypothetical protein [Methylophaga sp.]HCD06043.1 hypothetical protein [Methylophaga sp.]|tara:strand:- start:14130 stop:15827 length:1698 start_codon:yes stop_codon:yes gene_type:complete
MKLNIKQRGAIGLLGIMTLLLATLFVALAVDTGRLLMEQRRMQTVADMAALDASALAGHCGEGDLAQVQALAQASAARNNHVITVDKTLDVSLGRVDTVTAGLRQFTTTTADSATAVQVIAAKSVPASFFAGGILGRSVNLSASAVAERQGVAGFVAGSSLIGLSEQAVLNSLLSGILGSPVNLNVLSYQGIAAANITLAELAGVSTTIASTEELLSSNLSLNDWLNLYADAVNASDAADVGLSAAMQSLVMANVSELTARFSDIVAVTSDAPEAAAEASVNLFDLLMTTAFVANGSQAINLPLSVSLPGNLLNVTSQLNITEPPKMVIGPPGRNAEGQWRTYMETAQFDLTTLVQSTVDLNVAGLVGTKAEIDLALQVDMAQGSAWLQTLQCGQLNNNRAIATIGVQPGTAMLNLTQASDPDAETANIDISATLLLLGRVPVANVGVGLDIALQNPTSTDLIYEVNLSDPDDLPQTQHASTAPGLAISNISQGIKTDVTLLGAISLPLLDQLIEQALLNQVLTPLLSEIGQETVDPLLSVLGLEIGAMHVNLFTVEVERPDLKV